MRPPDLVKRAFSATHPNELWVVDFTYVATWSGMVFTAFVTDVFSRRIVGWRTAASMPTWRRYPWRQWLHHLLLRASVAPPARSPARTGSGQ